MSQEKEERLEMNDFADRPRQDMTLPAPGILLPAHVPSQDVPVSSRHITARGVFGGCCLALLAALVTGCGDGRPAPLKVYPVTGTVKFQGKPAAGASVTLIPKDESLPEDLRPNAITDETGHFDLGTYSDVDGAPEGEYSVTITWRPLVTSGGSVSPGPNVLPVRYSQPETSQLTAQVGDDETELQPFELTN